MILAVLIYSVCLYLNVFANEYNDLLPVRFIEVDNGDTKKGSEIIYNKYMDYKDAKLALKSILTSVNNIINVNTDDMDIPRKQKIIKSDTRQNIMIDNFGNVVRYKFDTDPEDDIARLDRGRRDAPVLNTSSRGVPRSGANVTKYSDRRQKILTSAGYTHNPDTCKIYNDNLQALWATLNKYIKADDSVPDKMHLHNIALIIKAYIEHIRNNSNESNEKKEKEKSPTPYDKKEDENIVNEVIEYIRNNMPSYRHGVVVREIVDFVMKKLKPNPNSTFSCKTIEEDYLHDIIDLAYQKYLEDVDCRNGKSDVVDLTRMVRHSFQAIRKMFSPYYQKRTIANDKVMPEPKKSFWANYDDHRRINKASNPIKPLSENPNKFYNEMLKLYDEENKVSDEVRVCENLALETFLDSVKSVIQRFIRKSECGPTTQSAFSIHGSELSEFLSSPETINEQNLPDRPYDLKNKPNDDRETRNKLIKYIYRNKIWNQSNTDRLNSHDFRIPVSSEYFKVDNAIPFHITSMKLHQPPNLGSENDEYISNTNNTKPIIGKKNQDRQVNQLNILLDPAHEVTHANIKEIESDDHVTEKQYFDYMDINNAKGVSDNIAQEESNVSSLHRFLDSIRESAKTEFAELTYVIHDPQVIMYQPQYLVTHLLPYETYLRNYKKIINNNRSSNGGIQLLNAVKLLPGGSKLLYSSKNNVGPLRYLDKLSRKVLDIAKSADVLSSMNKTRLLPKNKSTHNHTFEDKYINLLDVENNKTNVSNIFDVHLGEKDYMDNFETADYVETKSEEFFIDNDNEAKKNGSNLQSTGMEVIGKEIHTNGHGKILWNNYPIKRPKYTLTAT